MDKQRANEIARMIVEDALDHITESLQVGMDYHWNLRRFRDEIWRGANTDAEYDAAAKAVIEALEQRIDRS